MSSSDSRDSNGPERRQSPRADLRIDMAGQLSSSRVRLANVSSGGCLVYGSCVLNEGDVHVLRFGRDAEGDAHSLTVRVVYAFPVEGQPDAACVAGLAFTDESLGNRAAIAALVALTEQSEV
jgi:hypothetical protein